MRRFVPTGNFPLVMDGERLELILKAARRVDELRQERAELTQAIDRKLKAAEQELAALVDGGASEVLSLHGEGGGIQDQLVAMMRLNPKVSYEELTEGAYGEDTAENRNKCRANIYRLRRKGRIRIHDNGYEVVK